MPTRLQLGFLSRLGGCQGENTKQCRMHSALPAARACCSTASALPSKHCLTAVTGWKFGIARALLLVAQEMRQNDGSSATHKAFCPSPFPKTWAQGLKPRMNTTPRCIATTENHLKSGKKTHTSKTNPAFTEQEAGNHPRICHCRQEIWMSQKKPNCQICHSQPVSPQLPLAIRSGGGPVPLGPQQCLQKGDAGLAVC